MKRKTVYLETTVISYVAGRPSTNILVLAHQKITQDWWPKSRIHFDCFISPFVLSEISGGDPLAVKRGLKLIAGLPLLEPNERIEQLAFDLIHRLKIPETARLDAFHIAFAAFYQIHFLVTWNCTHIANANHFDGIREVIAKWKLSPPIICTPEEL